MRNLVLGTLACMAIVLGVVTFTTAGDKHDHGKAAAAIGAPAPQFSLQDQNGKTVNLSDFAGKIVVLEWFNDGCPFVVRHYKNGDMNKTASGLADKGVVWLAINSTSGTDSAHNKQVAAEWKLERPILDDAAGNVGHMYGAKTTPNMFIIDKDGKLAYMGAIDNNPNGDKKEVVNYVEKGANELIAGSSVSESQTKPYGCSVKYGK
jgi:peroxiredoxin